MGKRKKKPNKENPEEFVVPDPRTMEQMMSEVTALLKGQDFESIEEAQAFLNERLAEGDLGDLPSRRPPETPLEKAQDLVYQALEATGKKRIQLARKALKTSKDCADAYVLLAEETAQGPEEARELYEQGVKAGERALGPEAFEEDEGHFWGILETRPYMRARQGLALCLWALDEEEAALEHYKGMLRLNPGDNQGIRYLLATGLLETDNDQELGELLEQYEDDVAATWLYTRALWTFRQKGATTEANTALEEAVEANPSVPQYLLGEKKLPSTMPGLIGLGDESEAVEYFAEALTTWLKTPGAIDWLRVNS